MTAAPPGASRVWRPLFAVIAVLATLTTTIPATATELAKERTFEDETWSEGLVDLRSLDLSRTRLVANGYAGGGLDVTIPAGGFRGFGPFDRLEPAVEQAWFRYHVRLTNWDAASTGKLPGLAGIYSSSARGCIPPTASQPGWSARGMFDSPGTHGAPPGRIPIGTYLYHADQEGDCGDGLWWPNASLEQGRWQCIEGYVRMNTPGSSNGVLKGWLDGTLRLNRANIAFRTSANVGVRHMWHNVYFGGSWPTPNALSLQYDEVAVSTTGRVGCLPAFTDLGSTIHARALNELHDLGFLYGCDYRKACPLRVLTRGEAAALIARILELPPSSSNHFWDDNDSTFEDVINRLADARITLGCAPGRFCPDRAMSRAEFAAMMVRALHLSGKAPDVFDDDRGHWAEDDINLFAKVGLTDGCGSGRFCPDRALTRDEAAAFFYRGLGLLRPVGLSGGFERPEFSPSGDPPAIPAEERD